MLVLGIILIVFGGSGLLILISSKPILLENDTEDEKIKKEKAFNFWLKRHEIAFGLLLLGILLVLVSIFILALLSRR